MKTSLFIIALAVAATACNNAGKQQAAEQTAEVQAIETTAPIADLFDKEWKLKMLNGEPIVVDTTFKKEPLLVFDKESNRVSGNGGCNGFGSNFELKGDGEITLSDIAATQMACPNLDLEGRFFEVLRAVKGYRIEGNTLTLTGENGQTAALLEWVK